MADDEESSSEGSTDIFSDKFDSLKALYSNKVRVPVPTAPVFDNISKFESIVLKGVVIKTNDKEIQEIKEEKSTRRLPSHQEPIETKNNARVQRYREKNVITRMQRILGPLALLYEYMESRTRVKVYTRNANGIRGHVEAYIAAFDKHWNLALEDCLELWSRKVKRKAPALGDPVNQINVNTNVIVKKNDGKLETLERHVSQLLLRGEQVVLIVKID